jgi:AcrR family transcriptional regulator
VAAAAGVSIGSLYQYVADEEALIAAVFGRYQDAFRDRLVAGLGGLAGLPLADAVAELVRVLIALHAENPHLHNALGSGMPDAERRLFQQVTATYLAAHRDAVRRPDLPLAAAVALEIAEALAHGAALHAPERLADPAFAREVTDVLVRYLVRDEHTTGSPRRRAGGR